MALWSWWPEDALTHLPPIPTFRVHVEQDACVLHPLTGLTAEEIDARLAAGHRAYVARLDRTPVAYGWVATLAAAIGELDVSFVLTPGDRYLWDFATLSAWRGRGLYPRLLQAILRQEGEDGPRFWIINAPENRSSAAGIAKAGFSPVSDLAFGADRGVASQGPPTERARVGAALLGVPLLEAVRDGRVLSPCWRCVVAAAQTAADASCWPYQDGVAVACTCSWRLPDTAVGAQANDAAAAMHRSRGIDPCHAPARPLGPVRDRQLPSMCGRVRAPDAAVDEAAKTSIRTP